MKKDIKKDGITVSDVLSTLGIVLIVYVVFLFGTLVLLGLTSSLWDTDETSGFGIIIFTLIVPALATAVYFYKDKRTAQLLEKFIETPAESPRMETADKYLRTLLWFGKLEARDYPKVQQARAACFEDGCEIPEKISYYCHILYDIDHKFAEKRKFKDSYIIPTPSVNQHASESSDSSCKAAAAAAAASYGMSNAFRTSSSNDYEDDDSIALDMEEAIDDDIMFHGGNPFNWDTRSDYMSDPFGFGSDDGDGDDDW